MAEDLYEQYAGLLDQQVVLAEEAVVRVVRAAFGDFSSDCKRHLRSLVPPRRPPATSGGGSSSQQMTRRQEEIETARDSAQRQIATALANGFGALVDLPFALGFSANQPSGPSISGSSTQATVGAIAANNDDVNSDDDSVSIKSEDTSECESDCESHSDDEGGIKEEAIEGTSEMAATAGTSNVNPNNNDTVSVKNEELTTVREIKEEIEDVHLNDQVMGNAVNETGAMQMMEEDDEERSNDNSNPSHSNFETVPSQLVNLNETNREQQSDALMIEGGSEPWPACQAGPSTVSTPTETEINQTATVKDEIVSSSESESDTDSDDYESDSVQVKEEDQEENEVRSIDNSSTQDSVPDDGSSNGESENVSQQEGNGHTVDSPGQAGPSTASNTASPLTRRSTRVSAKKVNYAEATENSLAEQQGTLTGIRKRKRSTGRSGKSKAPKRSRVSQAPTVAADETEESEDEDDGDPESTATSFSVIVRRLNCRVPGCKKIFPGKGQLDGHLLTKHGIEKWACKVKDCTESYATKDELTIHRNSTHDNLDNEWPCGQCEVTCNNYHDLRTHTYHYHEYGLFACSADKCDFTKKTRIKVKSHQRTHGPAKYRCTYAGCTSSFKKKSNLTTHSRVHSKEKPFPCSQCPKAFALKHSLTHHERVHSGLKPYGCTWPHCDYSASDQSTVIQHIRGVHFGLPKSKKKQAELRIVDNRDARLFVKKTTTTGN